MAGQIEAYRAEIFNFLRTCTVKFEPFAWIMGQSYMDAYGIEDPHAAWNPYYLNLAGEYTSPQGTFLPGDEVMTVYSVEEGKHLPFTKEMLATHPKTASLYKVGTTEYSILEERYPNQRGLIRAIAYPTGTVEDAIAANNLTLLGYDPSYLDINEQESLILTLKNFLDFCSIRWWIKEYTYEDMYAITFWWMLWQIIPVVLLTQRFKNIQTPYAHEFHVWEYLQSNGLEDYRDVLTNKQSLWLYRNMRYIEKNKGKQSNLKILAENLLEEVSASLIYKDMAQETASNFEPDLKPTPVFRSYDYVTDKEVKDEDLPTLIKRLNEIGVEPHTEEDYIKDKEEELGVQPHNELPTKFLELRRDPVDTSDEDLLINFLIDTFVYRLSLDDLNYEETVTDPGTNTECKLPIRDIFYLYNLCMWRSLGCDQDPEYLPTDVPVSMAFQRKRPQKSEVRDKIFFKEHPILINTHLNVDTIINTVAWWDGPFTKASDFIQTAIEQYQALLSFKGEIENSHSYLFHSAYVSVLYDIMIHKTVRISEPQTPYDTWIEDHPCVRGLLHALDTSDKPYQAYNRIAAKCFDLMFPILKVEGFKGSTRIQDKIYTSIRDLFIRLCSYNVIYLEMEREGKKYFKVEEPDVVWPLEVGHIYKGLWSWVEEEFIFHAKMGKYFKNQPFIVDYPVHINRYSSGWHRYLHVEYPIDHTSTKHNQLHTIHKYNIQNTGKRTHNANILLPAESTMRRKG